MWSMSNLSRRQRRTAQNAAAGCLLGAAFLSLIGSVIHRTGNQFFTDRASAGNDAVESILPLFSLTSSVLALMLARNLRSPTRQIIFIGGGMLIALAIFSWLSIGGTQ